MSYRRGRIWTVEGAWARPRLRRGGDMAAWASQVLKVIEPPSEEATKSAAVHRQASGGATSGPREGLGSKQVRRRIPSGTHTRSQKRSRACDRRALREYARRCSGRRGRVAPTDASPQTRDAPALAGTQGGKARSQMWDRLAARTVALAAEATGPLIPEASPSATETVSADSSITTERDK